MNMKIRKNFTLLAVLAIAVFVASAGLVVAAENVGEGETVTCSCSDGSEVTYTCADGPCAVDCGTLCGNVQDWDKTEIMTDTRDVSSEDDVGIDFDYLDADQVRRYEEGYIVPSQSQSVRLGDSGASVTCGESTFIVNQGSGSGSDVGGHCTSDSECFGDMVCDDQLNRCVHLSDDDAGDDDSGTASGSEEEETREGGFLGIEGLFTAN